MSFFFGEEDLPTPAPVPASPSAVDNEAAQAERNAAERAAIAEAKSRGRMQTVVAGRKIAADEQEEKGLLSAKRRSASRDILG